MVKNMDETPVEFLKKENLMAGLNFTQLLFKFPKRNNELDPEK